MRSELSVGGSPYFSCHAEDQRGKLMPYPVHMILGTLGSCSVSMHLVSYTAISCKLVRKLKPHYSKAIDIERAIDNLRPSVKAKE